MTQTLTIGAVVYDHVNALDLVGVHEPLGWLGAVWKEASVRQLLVGERKDQVVTAARGIRLLADAGYDDCPPLDVLLVPGGTQAEVLRLAREDERLMRFLRERAGEAKWVCSVCTGALLLAAAGVLHGRAATTHWRSLPALASPEYGVRVADGYPRYVEDGGVLTAGGVASGLDAALALAANLTGDAMVARQIQLALQYHPQPPYGDGDPAVADPAVVAALLKATPRPGDPVFDSTD